MNKSPFINPISNDIPKYKEMLQSVLDGLKKETGKTLELSIKEFSPSNNFTKWNHTFGSICNRSNIQVYNMDPKYRELEEYGQYCSRDALLDQIKRLQFQNKFEETMYFSIDNHQYQIGKCSICHSFGNLDMYGQFTAMTPVNSKMCANSLCEDRSLSTIWDDVVVKESKGDIIVAKNGFCPKVIGHYKFVKNLK